jgi:Flp pilus assembly protein TadD
MRLLRSETYFSNERTGIGRAHLDLGILYADSGHNNDAILELKGAAQLIREDANPRGRLARIYQSMGDKTGANLEFRPALQSGFCVTYSAC